MLQPLKSAEREYGDKELPLTAIAARQLARLMAYKDEYEVARLFSEPAFTDALRRNFSGEPGRDYRLNFSLAIPLLAGKDHKGRMRKKQFGPGLMKVFPYLARLKAVRGTWLDPFAYTQERRRERRLIDDYAQMIRELAQALAITDFDMARQWLELPAQVRGYGHVKAASIEGFEKEAAQLANKLRFEAFS